MYEIDDDELLHCTVFALLMALDSSLDSSLASQRGFRQSPSDPNSYADLTVKKSTGELVFTSGRCIFDADARRLPELLLTH